MKRNAMRTNLRRSILKSLGRYIAIVAIIALGASMFVGLLMTKSDMVATGKRYADDQNMFDLRLASNYGWTQEHVDAVAQLDGVVEAEGLVYQDLVVHVGESTDESVYRFYAIPEKINKISLRGGRMPEKADECLADGYFATDEIIGTTITIAANNTEDALESMVYKTYTVVGYCSTPLYMDMNRGTTAVGNGSLASYLFVPGDAFDLDYFPEIHITIPGDYALYSDEYNDAMEAMADYLEPLLEPMVEERRIQVKADAEEAYREGIVEYAEGLWEFSQGREVAKKELADAYQQLMDGEQAILDTEQMMADGEKQIAEAKATLAESEASLQQSRQQFASLKSMATAQLEASRETTAERVKIYQEDLDTMNAEIAVLEAKLAELDAHMGGSKDELESVKQEIGELDVSIASADAGIAMYESLKAPLPADSLELRAEIDRKIEDLLSQKDADTARRAELQARKIILEAFLEEPLEEYEAVETELSELKTRRTITEISLRSTESTLKGLENSIASLESQFAPLEQQLADGEAQIASGRWQLIQKEQELALGKLELEFAREDLEKGWTEYEEGKLELERELADAETDLREAREELADAREMIDKMTENTVFVMDRNSNIGYNSLDSASDIVQGVSRVFPAFFLLVAALVCITTMTRMIDEERTQIGTLKALGYSNAAIISKYLIYAGSGAVVGCGLGVLVGSAAFPVILWEAYKIMLYITDGIVLQINWLLCGIVVGAYTLVMLLVTWYCCRRTLREEPAELIRPKAPDAGKKIFLELLPFWGKISFLNKVTIRNIFRYRQRLAMMMVGIGGCTALLVTGFGLRDSIVNVVDYQFEEVTVYDMSVYFAEGQTREEQAAFLKDVKPFAKNAAFYHQSSIELEYDKQVKEIFLIAGNDEIQDFIDMHSGEEALPMPGMDQVILSVGVSEALGVEVGDRVQMRNADMQVLDLTVSGIYDNHVYNYAIVSPGTITSQWGAYPEMQMAFVQVKDGQDVHRASAEITGMSGVMNVSVSEDLAGMVSNMMQALDLVVIVVVVCAGLLAAIVLYNLTNININERIREIATIKVLGFNSGETAAYVFKENLSLTAIGSVFGLGLGYLLLLFVMSQIKIDMVWFKALVFPQSYLWAIALTMLSAVIVDFIFYFKLEKVNMAEALKSVE